MPSIPSPTPLDFDSFLQVEYFISFFLSPKIKEFFKWEIEITSVNMNFFRKKVFNTSCRARRAHSKNLGLRLQNRLWALWRPRKGPKTRKMFYQPLGHMSRSKAEMIYDMN